MITNPAGFVNYVKTGWLHVWQYVDAQKEPCLPNEEGATLNCEKVFEMKPNLYHQKIVATWIEDLPQMIISLVALTNGAKTLDKDEEAVIWINFGFSVYRFVLDAIMSDQLKVERERFGNWKKKEKNQKFQSMSYDEWDEQKKKMRAWNREKRNNKNVEPIKDITEWLNSENYKGNKRPIDELLKSIMKE
jgi:hypothetical protein